MPLPPVPCATATSALCHCHQHPVPLPPAPYSTDDHTLLWLLNHIRLGIPELIVQVRHHRHTRVYAFFVTATYESLLRGADEMGLRKPVKAEFGGGMRGFSCEEDYIYENIENELGFFSSQVGPGDGLRGTGYGNLRAKQGESLHNIHFLEGQPIIPELAARGVIQQLFPLHEQRILKRLMKSWVQAVCEAQPLDDICDYFGVKIAMYFAWLGFYTSAMVYPAVFGSILYTFTDSDQAGGTPNAPGLGLGAVGAGRGPAPLQSAPSVPQTSQDISCVVFAIFNVVWATLFLEEWKRRGAEFAYKWGTLDTPAESLEEPRPQFREFVLSVQELPRVLRFLPKIILAVIVTACDELYKKVALWLNDMENYRLQSAYEKHLIIKIVLFQFVNSYLSLFYIGFYLKDMERLKELLLILSLSQSLARQLREALLPSILLHLHLSLIFLRRLLRLCWTLALSKTLATLLITRQLLQNVREVSQPHLYRRLRRARLGERGVRQLGRALLRLLAPRPAPLGPPEPPRGRKKCLNGGCGVPEEDEDEEEQRERRGSDAEEEEGALDCGLKLRRVSFVERGERRAEPAGPEDEPFLEEGSPTMVEKGMDPAAVFELCEEEEEAEAQPGSPGRAAEPAVPARRRRREEEEGDEEGRKRNRASWIDPPEEDYSTQLTQAEVESCMKKYEDTFQDYQEMFIQFGYVVLFSSAFPLAAACALLNNAVMEAMGVLAIVVNCYLLAQCGQLRRLCPWLSPEGAIVSVVVLEHFALLLKYVIQVAIPDIPAWVAEEMAKLEYQRREAFKKHERQAQHHFQQQQRRRREEEERQRQAELQARRERDEAARAEAAPPDPGHDKGQPKRPSSLLATNNVLKLKQIIPLQGRFLAGPAAAGPAARSPQSPTGAENKLPAFLKFLKPPEARRDAGTERAQSPTKPFNPGKLFNFGKSEALGGNGAAAPQPRADAAPGKAHLNEEAPREEAENRPEEEGGGARL
ncbi:Anoctamin-8 [Lonchura striata]|uniref:Anoctamin n=1 Tax=Lonchura striata TaxID=40157 RepID=A0A218UC37_9PASE|nr:Anoctamin-8 [Lonchura striata domestica]